MDKQRKIDRNLEESMKRLICQAHEAEQALLEEEAEWLEQSRRLMLPEPELHRLTETARHRRRLRSIQKAAASIAAVVAILLFAANFQGVVQAAQELFRWVESHIDFHAGPDPEIEITTETGEEAASETEYGQITQPEAGTEQHTEDSTQAASAEADAGKSIGSLQADAYMAIGEPVWMENAGMRQVIHFEKADRAYFELWDMTAERYCGSFKAAGAEWDFDRGHWYVFSEDCNEDGKQDIVLLQVKEAAGGTLLSIEYFLQENGGFYSGGQAQYRSGQLLHTYKHGDMRGDVCYVSVRNSTISISYVDQENDGQCFYAASQDGGITWTEWNLRYDELSEKPMEAAFIWHQDLGEGNIRVIVGSEANTGAGQKQTFVYSMQESGLAFLSRLDAPEADYIRCCYFADQEHGYISYCYRTQPEPVVYRSADAGVSWSRESVDVKLEEYAYAEVCAFRKEDGRVLMDVYVSMNAKGEPEIRTIMIAEAAD